MKEKIYYIYHIPNKKIGVTTNKKARIEIQQGYKPGEYEILESSSDINYISKREIELQKEWGYKIDRQLYKNLSNKPIMNINITEQTTTFPFPKQKLKGNLMDSLGISWELNDGFEVKLDTNLVAWIEKNSNISMYRDKRSFVYNKSMKEYLLNKNKETEPANDSFFDLIRMWANDRGLYIRGNSNTQYIKLMEEAGELAQALLKRDKAEIYDAIGDMIVVLTNLAHLEGVTVEDCIQGAYDEITNRKGKMVNGTFVKETL
jgi:NTP pyrophosphatase (non-canonical NTP hydrolase)